MVLMLGRFCVLVLLWLSFGITSVQAAPFSPHESQAPAILVCYSGGEEIVRKVVLEGPVADEYKFAHEVKIQDEAGERWLNFSGGICLIDQGEVVMKKPLAMTDQLSCYSGGRAIVTFEVYGQESTIDEYVEGRTFWAKASGNAFNSDRLHRYLLFGGSTCIGEETAT